MGDNPASPGNHSFDRQTTLRIMGQGIFRHFLLHFKTSGLFISIFWNRLVYVSSHLSENLVKLPANLAPPCYRINPRTNKPNLHETGQAWPIYKQKIKGRPILQADRHPSLAECRMVGP